jgi:DNA-binding response OmpR family regulator
MRRDVVPPRQLVGDPRELLLIERDERAADLLIRQLGEVLPQLGVTWAFELPGTDTGFAPGVDCVLLDIATQDEPSTDVVHRVRSLYPDLPVVVMTPDDDDDAGTDALAAGAQDYISKRRAADGVAVARAIRHSVQRSRA